MPARLASCKPPHWLRETQQSRVGRRTGKPALIPPPGGRQSARQLREPEAEVAFKGAAIASMAIVPSTRSGRHSRLRSAFSALLKRKIKSDFIQITKTASRLALTDQLRATCGSTEHDKHQRSPFSMHFPSVRSPSGLVTEPHTASQNTRQPMASLYERAPTAPLSQHPCPLTSLSSFRGLGPANHDPDRSCPAPPSVFGPLCAAALVLVIANCRPFRRKSIHRLTAILLLLPKAQPYGAWLILTTCRTACTTFFVLFFSLPPAEPTKSPVRPFGR